MLKKVLAFLIIFCCIFLAAIAVLSYLVNRPYQHDADYPKTAGNSVSIILVDGLSQAIFNKNLDAQQLPNLQKLITRSTYVKNGIGSFPSMTGYAFYPFITGKDATTSEIYGLRWFDRSLTEGNLRNYVGRTNVHMNQDINAKQKNIFEMSGDQYTCSINSYMNKGVKESVFTGWQHTVSKFAHVAPFNWLQKIPFWGDRISSDFFEHETYTMEIAKKQLAKNPKVQWITLPSLDAMNHVLGTTPDYDRLLIHIDSLLGDFIKHIDSLDQSDTRALAIITDHGVSDVNQNLDLVQILKDQLYLDIERGQSVHVLHDDLDTPLSQFAHKDGYLVINGNLGAYLYFKNPDEANNLSAWKQKLMLDQLQNFKTPRGIQDLTNALVDQPGIGLIAAQKNDSTIWVQLENQTASITKNRNGYLYTPMNGDPLGYKADSLASNLIDQQFHTADQWLRHTIKTDFPDAIYRLYELMSKPDVGDILICSKKGYDLAADYEIFVGNYKGGHGGLHKDLLQVPYILHCPNEQPMQIDFARSEDIGAMIIDYLFRE